MSRAEMEAEYHRQRIASIPPRTPEQLANDATREAWCKLPINDRLIDGANAASLGAIEILAMHTMCQLFTRQYLSKIHLYVESGLSDLYADIMDILQTGIDELPTGYAAELIERE